MEIMGNPLERTGDRNFECTHYRQCLDYAARQYWDSWDCSECEHCAVRSMQLDVTELQCKPVMYYSLPLEYSGSAC